MNAMLALLILRMLLTCGLQVVAPISGTAQNPTLSSFSPIIQPQTSNARFTSGNSATIPLEIDNNIILLQVSVNGSKPMRFIFDTGASHTVLQSQRGKELGLKPEEQVSGTATGGAISGSLTSGVSLKVAGAEVSNQQIGLLDFPVPPGFEFHGVIGYDFIKEFVVEIDYLKKTMNLYDPKSYNYRGQGETLPILIAGQRIPFVQTTIIAEDGTTLEARLGIDTGADRTIIFSSSFVVKNDLVKRMSQTSGGAGRGAGGEQKILVGKVKGVRLGKFLFSNPPVGLELSGSAKEADGVIGGEIFRRFKLIIDYSRQRMILEPNKSFNDPYQFESDG
jgi:aspartyl protease